jgi:oxygen-independent coproporphyrinogen-3 oxidase
MTYRTSSAATASDQQAFAEFLKTENTNTQNKELQPWIPFCEGRCAFCYFPINCKKETVTLYVQALKKALEKYAKTRYIQTSEFQEVYVGGGSPNVLSQEQITDLLTFCRQNFNLTSACITKFTTSTTNLSEQKIRSLAENKVHQLDIGIQTFNDSLRQMLMMRDNSAVATEKIKTTKKHGMYTSIDLLYNLPGQSLKQWRSDIELALELDVESVDCYPLELYPETILAKRIAAGELPAQNKNGQELEMYQEAYSIFKAHGYVPTCHNRFSRIKEDLAEPSSEVVGSGAGFFMGRIGEFIFSDIEDITEYIATVQQGTFPIAKFSRDLPEEEMGKAMMQLYVRVPVDREQFKKQFGKFPEEAFPDIMQRLQQNGLIETEDNKIRLTEKGDPWRANIAWEFFNQ